MGIWDSLRRFSTRGTSTQDSSTKKRRGQVKNRLKERGLRMEQFEDRVLLSITTPNLDDIDQHAESIFGNTVYTLPCSGEMALVARADSPDEFRPIKPLNVDAADSTNVEHVTSGGSLGLGLDGNGYTVGVWDGGSVLSTHQEFGSRVSVIDGAESDAHATHVGGTIGAAGTDSAAKGMASAVDIRSYDWNSDFAEMAADGSLIDVSNHSYGYGAGWEWTVDLNSPTSLYDIWYGDMSVSAAEDSKFGSYTGEASQLDQVLHDNPELLSVWAAGNDRDQNYLNLSSDGNYISYFSADPGIAGWAGAGFYLIDAATFPPPGADGNSGTGYDSILPTQTAKNNLMVGAINDVTPDPYMSTDIQMSSFSGWGPTDDGRIKPDVVGNGVQVYSSVDGSDSSYDIYDGTSMASPNVAGTAVLLKQHFEQSIGYSPLSSTLKGLIIHTASDAGNVGPDYTFGWGLVDAKEAAEFVNEASKSGSGAEVHEGTYAGAEITMDVFSAGINPLTATLVWTDVAGAAHSGAVDDTTPALVNDLNIWLTDQAGNTYSPWTVNPANPGASAVRNQANHLDNVEQVKIDVPNPGQYTIHIGATSTVSPQDFSLLVTNQGEGATPELVLVIPQEGGFVDSGDTLNISPRELTLRFNEGQQFIDETTTPVRDPNGWTTGGRDGIQVTRAGANGILGDADDEIVDVGWIGSGDRPNDVILRFADSLPDDQYRITIVGSNDFVGPDGQAVAPLRNIQYMKFHDGQTILDEEFEFDLDLGTQVTAVVPQPVVVTESTLTVADVNDVSDGDMFTLSDGKSSVVFEFDTDGNTATDHVAIDVNGLTTETQIAAAIHAAIHDASSAVLPDGLNLTSNHTDPNDYVDIARDLSVPGSRIMLFGTDLPFAVSETREQLTDTIEVYFNDDDLDPISAANVDLYQLIHTQETATPEDDTIILPDSVSYDPDLDRALIVFGDALDTYGTGAYRLRIGNEYEVYDTTSTPVADAGDSFHTASELSFGTPSGAQSLILTAAIDPQPLLLEWPGAVDEPGHRDLATHLDIEIEDHYMTGESAQDATDGITEIYYNFRNVYGYDQFGTEMLNNISEAQKDRAREVFALYSEYLGVSFVETVDQGYLIATGDLKAAGLTSFTGDQTGVAYVSDQTGYMTALMDKAENWGSSEYGGDWFRVAMHEIGHLLGYGHAYDMPAGTIMGSSEDNLSSTNAEPVFPGDADIIHGQHMYRPDSIDIDLYRFELNERGTLNAEILAERLNNSSHLDSVVTLYRVETIQDEAGNDKLTYNVIARNDDYYSEDSFLELYLQPGVYFVGVSASGNTDYDPNIDSTGVGGTSQGEYKLRMTFTPGGVDPDDPNTFRGDGTDHLVDVDGEPTKFDGDADGVPGGVYNFWFNVQQEPLFVDKLSPADPDDQDGSLAKPYSTISAAFAAAQPGNIVRILGNNYYNDDPNQPSSYDDNIAYGIGTNPDTHAPLDDGVRMELPRGVTVMIDAGSLFKLSGANIDVGSAAEGIDRSSGALQVLGTPENPVPFTSFRDADIGVDIDPSNTVPEKGDWGGLVFRNELDYDFIEDYDPAEGEAPRQVLETQGIFLNYVNHADIRYGGGQVSVDGIRSVYAPLHMIEARPTISRNVITKSADAAISGDPNSFADTRFESWDTEVPFTSDYDRVGPEVRGNYIVENSTNGMFVRIQTAPGAPIKELEVPGRFDDWDVVHVIPQALFLNGTPGGPMLAERTTTLGLIDANRIQAIDASSPADDGLLNVEIPDQSTFAIFDGSTRVVFEFDLGYGFTPGHVQIPYTLADTADDIAAAVRQAIDDARLTLGLDIEVDLVGDVVTLTNTGPLVRVEGFGTYDARIDARLQIDPGLIVKMDGSRIEVEMGAQLIAEGRPGNDDGAQGYKVILTSLLDNRFGAGGEFNTSANTSGHAPSPGDWAGLYFAPTSTGSMDNAIVAYAGGLTSIEGGFANFNPVEIYQAQVRIANSRFEHNTAGSETGDRNGRGPIEPATIHVRGAQPAILDNDFLSNDGSVISVDLNSQISETVTDWGRGTGWIADFPQYANNSGPLVRANRMTDNDLNAMRVRGGILTTESVWDDTDIVHVLQEEIVIPNYHHEGGLRLISGQTESLVIKLSGTAAGFTAAGDPLEIEDRIGGTLQVLGTPGRPVVMTALEDDSFSAGFTMDDSPQFDTNNDDDASQPSPGAWRSVRLDVYSNDRNVATVHERENAYGVTEDQNWHPSSAEVLGAMAPEDKAGDDNLRLGFHVHGKIRVDDPTDVDVYSFDAPAGTEIWLDIDRTNHSLDLVIELIDADGNVLSRSDNSPYEEMDGQIDQVSSVESYTMDRDYWLRHDFYSTNDKDPGMRLILPGAEGEMRTYYVRVRSVLSIGGILPASAYTDGEIFTIGDAFKEMTFEFDNNGSATGTNIAVDLTNPAGVAQAIVDAVAVAKVQGLDATARVLDGKVVVDGPHLRFNPLDTSLDHLANTVGDYQMQLRLREMQEVPGSTVQFADIRYATNGIEVLGQPGHSPLLGESAEVEGNNGNNNNTLGTAQNLGNLLVSDQSTISVAGNLLNASDVDWYRMTVDYDHIQDITNLQNTDSVWATMFDIDYADGMARPDLTMWVFDANRRLILIGGNSNVADDQPEPISGASIEDLSRGSVGARDPFIGTAYLPEGDGTTYYIAITSSLTTADALDDTNRLVRREPINSVDRIIEERIDPRPTSQGGNSGMADEGGTESYVPGMRLDLMPNEFTFGDTIMWVNDSNDLHTIDPLTGELETYVTPDSKNIWDSRFRYYGDIMMRNDGRLYTMAGRLSNVTAQHSTIGDIRELNTGDASIQPIYENDEAIVTWQMNSTRDALEIYNAGVQIEGMTFDSDEREMWGVGNITPSMREWYYHDNLLYKYDPDGDAIQYPGPHPRDERLGTSVVAHGWLTPALTLAFDNLFIGGRSVQPGDTFTIINLDLDDPDNPGTPFSRTFYDLPPGLTPQATGAAVAEAVNNAHSDLSAIAVSHGLEIYGDGFDILNVNGEVVGCSAASRVGAVGGRGGTITGLAYSTDTAGDSQMYAVSDQGDLFIVHDPDSWYFQAISPTDSWDYTIVEHSGVFPNLELVRNFDDMSFSGLEDGPDNVEDGRYADMLFATTSSGDIVAFDTGGDLQPVFLDGESQVSTGLGNLKGVTFSPIDYNLWHWTTHRGTDVGHGATVTYDESRTNATHGENPTDPMYPEAGDFSYYFGLENTHDSDWSEYQPGESSFHADPRPNTAALDTINMPGGAHGSLTSGEFSLEGYEAEDKPVLYFNYFADAEDTDHFDAFRVYVSSDGAKWDMIATNTDMDWWDYRRNTDTGEVLDELPVGPDMQHPGAPDERIIDEIIDVGDGWRQARIDLSRYAGLKDLQIRFDVTTASDMGVGEDEGQGEYITTPDAWVLADGALPVLTDQATHDDRFTEDNTRFWINQVLVDGDLTGGDWFEYDMGLSLSVPNVAGHWIQDGEWFEISDGVTPTVRFEFDSNSSVAGGNTAISINAAMSSGQVVDAIVDAVNNTAGFHPITAIKDDYRVFLRGAVAVTQSASPAVYVLGDAPGSVTGHPDAARAVGIPLMGNMRDFEVAEVVTKVLNQEYTSRPQFGGTDQLLAPDPQEVVLEGTTFTLRAVDVQGIYQSIVFEFDNGDGTALTSDAAVTLTSPLTSEDVAEAVEKAINDYAMAPLSTSSEIRMSAVTGVYNDGTESTEESVVILDGLITFVDDAGELEHLNRYDTMAKQDGEIGELIHLYLDGTGPYVEQVQETFYFTEDYTTNRRAVTTPGVLGYANSLYGDQAIYPNQSAKGYLGNRFNDYERGQDNDYEGFYIDDIVIGFAERGEMVTDSSQIDAFTSHNKVTTTTIVTEGEYQLEIRRGEDYAQLQQLDTVPTEDVDWLQLNQWIDTNDRLANGFTLTLPAATEIAHRQTFVLGDGLHERTYIFLDETMGGGAGGMKAIYFNSTMNASDMADAVAQAINEVALEPVDSRLNITAQSGPTRERVDLFGATSIVGLDYIIYGPVKEANLLGTIFPQGRVDITEAVDAADPTAADRLIENLLGPGVTLIDGTAKYTGGVQSSGFWTDEVNNGILLTSGDVYNSEGPNDRDNSGVNTNNNENIASGDGDADLDPLVAPYTTEDTSALEFEFLFEGGDLTFEYIFASEEYNEWVYSQYNDVFAFFLESLDDDSFPRDNIALVPGTNVPVSVDTINGGQPYGDPNATYPEYYVNNAADQGGEFMGEIEYDGFTTILTARADGLAPGRYRMKLAVADTADRLLDTGVFIKAGTFSNVDTGDDVDEFQVVPTNIGDENHPREKGQIVVAGNTVMYAQEYGIVVAPTPRSAGNNGELAHPGSGRTINEPNDLVPGIMIENNLVAYSGDGGIRFSGDTNPNGDPIGAVPFGRIVNNTVFGQAGNPDGIGILVQNNAGPTLMNNIVAGLDVGVQVDTSSAPNTELGGMLYQSNGQNVQGTVGLGSFPEELVPTDPLFVDAAGGNFYLDHGSLAIDSSINELEERQGYYNSILAPAGIPVSPIMAPDIDLFGQLRRDDPAASSPPGLGYNVFKDRGAIDRVDFGAPTSGIVVPLDNGPDDELDGVDHDVKVVGKKTLKFSIQLADTGGVGIDDASVVTSAIHVYRDLDESTYSNPLTRDPELVEGIDYKMVYNATNDAIDLVPLAGLWAEGYDYTIVLDNTIRDMANNTLQPNRFTPIGGPPEVFDGMIVFKVSLAGLDFGDAPDDPSDNNDIPTFLDSDGPRHIIWADFHLGSEVDSETDARSTAMADGDLFDDGVGLTGSGVLAGENVTFNLNVTMDNNYLIPTPDTKAYVAAWFDFDSDGEFGGPGDAFVSVEVTKDADNTLSVFVPATASGQVLARFRLGTSMAEVSSLTGQASDGEVEDYMFDVVQYLQDYGDAPATYPVTEADNGAWHAKNYDYGLYLGTEAPDSELDGTPDANAQGDDLTDVDDEDGVDLNNLVLVADGIAVNSIPVTVTGTGSVNAWIDLNADGDWADAGEHFLIDEPFTPDPTGYSTRTFNVTLPDQLGVDEAISYARFRLSSTTGLGYDGPDLGAGEVAVDGEVEDYEVFIVREAHDYGDAPDGLQGYGSYPTLISSNGASHLIVSGLSLGAEIDVDFEGQPNTLALGDDVTYPTGGVDDEDGVIFEAYGMDALSRLVPGETALVNINVTNTLVGQQAYLYGWIDFNRDGDWDDPGEQVFGDATGGLAVSADVNLADDNVLPITIPELFDPTDPAAISVLGDTYARFRLSTDATLSYDGAAGDGEVEDYMVAIEIGNSTIEGMKFNDRNANGQYDDSVQGTIPPIELITVGNGPTIITNTDDNWSSAQWLGFDFEYFGNTYSYAYVSPNGAISFLNPWSDAADSPGFPYSLPMIAPFWADADLSDSGGSVHLSRGVSDRGNPFVQIDWNNVGYYDHTNPANLNLRNTFSLYMEDAVAGDIVAFVYDTMQWTTGDLEGAGGFGGSGAEVGFNAGDGVQFHSQARPDSPQALADMMAETDNGVFGYRMDPTTGKLGLGERGVADVMVYLDLDNNDEFTELDLDGNGTIDWTEPWTLTRRDDLSTPGVDETGQFAFNNLFGGNYTVRELPTDDWVQTYPADKFYTVDLGPGETVSGLLFGNYRKSMISVGNASVAEGAEGETTVVNIDFERRGSFGAPVEVTYRTVDGTATTANNDYQGVLDTFTFHPQDEPLGAWDINPITHNTTNDYDYHVSGDSIVFEMTDGDDWEIYVYNNTLGGLPVRLTDNVTDDRFADVYRAIDPGTGLDAIYAVWTGVDQDPTQDDYEIFFCEISVGSGALVIGETFQLTDNDTDDKSPRVSDSHVTWWGIDQTGDSDIYLHDISTIGTPGAAAVDISDNNYNDFDPVIDGDRVVWHSQVGLGTDIFLYDGSTTRRITTNQAENSAPRLSGNYLVWQGRDGNDFDIFLHDIDTRMTSQVTADALDDLGPQISGSNIVWQGGSSNNREIFLYNVIDGGMPSNVSNRFGLDETPQIHGEKIVWHSRIGNDWEVMSYDRTQPFPPSNVSNNPDYDWGPQLSDELVVWRSNDGQDYEIVVATQSEPMVSQSVQLVIIGDDVLEDDEQFHVEIVSVSLGLKSTDLGSVGIYNDDGELDYGDAPASYHTLIADNGARHVTAPTDMDNAGYRLGAGLDSEPDGRPTADADGDDNFFSADEDGVVINSHWLPGNTVRLEVTASKPGKLDAWVDYNRDGDFGDDAGVADGGEYLFGTDSYDLVTGLNTIDINVPEWADLGNSYARFRFSREGNLSYIGSAASGEVEDYAIRISTDQPGVMILPTGTSTHVIEDGASDNYMVVLTAEPNDTVWVDVVTDDQLEDVSTRLEFTSDNWNVPQEVTITAHDDRIDEDPSENIGIVNHLVTSTGDGAYDGIAVAPLTVTIADNDVALVQIIRSGGSTRVSEDGSMIDDYEVVLTSEPMDDVQVTVNPGSQLTVASGTIIPEADGSIVLTFTAADWDTPQEVIVRAFDDTVVEGPHGASILHTASSAGDSKYDALGGSVASVNVDITDNAGLIIIQSGGSTLVTEGGADDDYTITLSSPPTSDVTVNLTPGSELAVDQPTLLFTPDNWDQPQTVTVSAVDDFIYEAVEFDSVEHAATSNDARYDGLAGDPVLAEVIDNDIDIADGILTLFGTNDDDTIELIRGNELAVTVNNELIYQGTAVDTVTFDGLAGYDEVLVTGSTEFEHVVLTPHEVTFTGTDFLFTAVNIEKAVVESGGGDDVADLHGSEGNDSLIGGPTEVSLSGNEYNHRVDNFREVQVRVRDDAGYDTAELRDSQGKDKVKIEATDVVKLYNPSYFIRGKFFEEITVISIGGDDSARLWDSQADDTFKASYEQVVIDTGTNIDSGLHRKKATLHGFENVTAYATTGGYDTIDLLDSPDDDKAILRSHKAQMFPRTDDNPYDYLITARKFDMVHARASKGVDVVRVHDTEGVDLLTAGFLDEKTWASLSAPVNATEMAALYDVLGFDIVNAVNDHSETTTNKKDVDAAVDFLLLNEAHWEDI